MTITDELEEAFKIAKAKGCPVKYLALNHEGRDLLTAAMGNPVTASSTYNGAPITFTGNFLPWELVLECGWTNKHGQECKSITALDVAEEEFVSVFEDMAPLDWSLPVQWNDGTPIDDVQPARWTSGVTDISEYEITGPKPPKWPSGCVPPTQYVVINVDGSINSWENDALKVVNVPTARQAPKKRMLLDPSKPMMIEGKPDTIVTRHSMLRTATGDLNGTVYHQGANTHITFNGTSGWVTSTTYSQSRVVNTDQHEEAAKQQAMEAADQLQDNPLWGMF